MDKKECSICKESKLLNEFYSKHKTNAKGENYIYYSPYCKSCTSKKSYQWALDNPERRKELKNAHNKRDKPKEDKRRWNTKRLENGAYRKWQQDNKDKVRAYNSSRQHKNHNITTEEWELCKEYFNNSCAYCGLHISEHFNNFRGELKWTDFHREHVNHQGANDITNCVPSCKKCNSSKWEYELNEWYNGDNESFTEERYIRIIDWLLSFSEEQVN